MTAGQAHTPGSAFPHAAGQVADGDLSTDDGAWTLTRAMSPRRAVRVADVDAYGDVVNTYTSRATTDGPAPGRPWAVYLADDFGLFRVLCFDLDAKGDDGAAAADRDAQLLAGLLAEAGMPHLVCSSGPAGGRHVWAPLAEPAEPATVRLLAELVRAACPTLDLSPLTNPRTGAVRPPGAPHRAGDRSRVLAGDPAVLADPAQRSSAAQLARLTTAVAQLAGADNPTPQAPTRAQKKATVPVPVDVEGAPHLPGPRRPLPAFAAAALATDAADPAVNASAILWTFLIGAAAARWHLADIAAHTDAPGLEHVRTAHRGGRGRRSPRRPGEAGAILRRQWDKAVQHVAGSDRDQVGTDETFDPRAGQVAEFVDQLQKAADTSAGRWTLGRGPADRRVLDALCVLALQAVTVDLEVDVRRLALMAGVGRETARTSLLRLAAEGILRHLAGPTGPHGARWSIDPHQVFHTFSWEERSQAIPRPPQGGGIAWRESLLRTLTARLSAGAHDLFTRRRRGLGFLVGNVYSRLTTATTGVTTTTDLTTLTGLTPESIHLVTAELTRTGVAERVPGGWVRTRTDRRDAAATQLGVAGLLAEREQRYARERVVWGWWRVELAWMTAPGRNARRRTRPHLNQPTLTLGSPWEAHPAYPRRPDGRASHRAAVAAVDAGHLDHLSPAPQTRPAVALAA